RHGLDLLVAQLPLEGGHAALAVRDAVDREVERGLRLVEVRPDVPGGARGGERVAAGAPGRGEDALAVSGTALGGRRFRRACGIEGLAPRLRAGERGGR